MNKTIRPQITKVSYSISSLFNLVKLVWLAYPTSFVIVILLTIIQGVIPLATAWLTKLLFDLLAQAFQNANNINWSSLAMLLAAQAILAILSQIIGPVNQYLNTEVGRKLTLNIQSIVYRKINSFTGIAYFENPQFYDTIRLAEQGVQFSSSQILSSLISFIQSLVMLISFIGVLFIFSSFLAGLVIVAAIPQLYAQLKLGRQHLDLSFELSPQQRRKSFYSRLLSNVHAAKEMRLFGLANHFLNRLLETQQEIHQAERRQQQYELRWEFMLGILSSLVTSGAFVIVVIEAFSSRLSLGDVVLYVNAAGSVQSALTGVVFALSKLNESTLFYTHFINLLALPQPLPVVPQAHPVPKLEAGIELRNVSFRYTEQHPWVIRRLNLYIPSGQCTALVGLNGAGKSTLVKLLTRLYDPTEGQILWDGIDIRKFEPEELRERIGAIFQDFIRYDLTVQENIGLGNIKQMEKLNQVYQAAIKAGIHSTITKLPQGYQTLLSRTFGSEGSATDLSGGEWQKIAVARMFMRDADFLILDEPTASLDAKAEYEIYNHFTELVGGRTSLLISHRFSTVHMADVIAVIEDGQITEYGPHDELLILGRTYANLFRMQAQPYINTNERSVIPIS